MNKIKRSFKTAFLLSIVTLLMSLNVAPIYNGIKANAADVAASAITPAFKVGNRVQINQTAAAETNGYDLKERRGWFGTVKSVTPTNFDKSKYEYDVEYTNGIHSVHVAEQDLRELSSVTPTFKIGDKVRIKPGAREETNGYDLSPHQNWVGTVKNVTRKDFDFSYFEYDVEYPDGTHNVHVSDQDVVPFNSAFGLGTHVQVNSTAFAETNGYDLRNHREWTGVVLSISPTNFDNSKYEYEVEFNDGSKNLHVAEQDLREISSQTPTLNIGEKVRIRHEAWSETNGYDLKPHQNWVGTVKSVTRNQWSYSYFEYDIEYPDGTHNVHVTDHDLVKYNSTFNLGSHVTVSDDAIQETNGFDLKPHNGWTGTVERITPTNYDKSKFEYEVLFTDGSRNLHVAEQDLRELSSQTPSFKVGDQIKIRKGAWLETNGYDLTPHQNQIGTIKSITRNTWSYSYFEYDIEYADGTHSVHVADQDLMVKPADKPLVTIVSTTNYSGATLNASPSRVDGKYRVYYAIDQNVRTDGLYDVPFGTATNMLQNQNARSLQGKVVYAETEVKLSNGENWVKIYITDANGTNGYYKWINKKGLSTGTPLWLYPSGYTINSYDKSGKIVYQIDKSKTKYDKNIREAIASWNAALGMDVFVEATTSTPASEVNLNFSDYVGPVGDKTVALYGSIGTITLNDNYFNGNYSYENTVKVLRHELGHSLGLNHTGIHEEGTDYDSVWSWSTYEDVMWSAINSADPESESVITANDISAVKMIIKMGDYANSKPLLTLKTIQPEVWIS